MNCLVLVTACLLVVLATAQAMTTAQAMAMTTEAAEAMTTEAEAVTTRQQMTTKRPCLHFYADTVGFTRLLMDIERSGAIKNVDEDLRVLPFEIMVAAQASELTEMLDRLGYVTILKILDELPADYQHEFVSHLVDHLEDEACKRAVSN